MHKSRQSGFTIIEMVISIFILSIAIGGIFSALSIVVILTSDSVDKLAATYLAQEGMEIVRNIRDTNWTTSGNWMDGLTGCESGCEADYTTGTEALGAWDMRPWSSGSYLCNDENGFFMHSASCFDQTKFKRKITITPVPDFQGETGNIIKVVVQVSWKKKATILNEGLEPFESAECPSANCVTVQESLYNWF